LVEEPEKKSLIDSKVQNQTKPEVIEEKRPLDNIALAGD